MKKILIALLLLLGTVGCTQKAEPELFILPEGFTGVVTIIFDQSDGQEKEYQDGRRVYLIPENGVLYTQFKPSYGILNRKFFYNQTEEELEIIELKEEIKPTVVYVLNSGNGSFSDLPKEGISEGSTDDYPKIEFKYYLIGKPSEKDSLMGLKAKRLDSLIKAY